MIRGPTFLGAAAFAGAFFAVLDLSRAAFGSLVVGAEAFGTVLAGADEPVAACDCPARAVARMSGCSQTKPLPPPFASRAIPRGSRHLQGYPTRDLPAIGR